MVDLESKCLFVCLHNALRFIADVHVQRQWFEQGMGKYNNAAWILWTLSWCRVHITTSHSKKEQNRKFEVNIDVDNHDHGHADCAVAQNIAQVCFAYCCETDLIAHFERV